MGHWIKRTLVHFIASLVAIWGTDYLLDNYFNINSTGLWDYIKLLCIFMVIMGLLNLILKPILKIVTIPLMIITLGLFTIVINALLLFIVTLFMPEVSVQWWEGYLYVPLALSVANWIAHHIIKVKKKRMLDE
jgi:putative membrane protein